MFIDNNFPYKKFSELNLGICINNVKVEQVRPIKQLGLKTTGLKFKEHVN